MEERQPDSFSRLQRLFRVIFRKFLKTGERDFLAAAGEEIKQWSAVKKPPPLIGPTGLILELYNKLAKLPAPGIVVEKTVIIDKTFILTKLEGPDWQYRLIDYLSKQLAYKLSRFLRTVLLVGSFGNLDFLPNWSDLDVILVLNDRVFDSAESLNYFKNRLQRLAPIFYQIDPLAHHEFIVVTDFDLRHYSDALFPVHLLSGGKRLSGQEILRFSCYRDQHGQRQALHRVYKHFEKIINNNFYSQTKYQWKNDLAHMFIWPSLLLQANRTLTSKKESFAVVKEKFPALDFAVLDQASSLRRSWRQGNWLRFCPANCLTVLPPSVSRRLIGLHRRLVGLAPPDQDKAEVRRLTDRFFELTVQSLSFISGSRVIMKRIKTHG